MVKVKTYGDLITKKNTTIPVNIEGVIRSKKKIIARKRKKVSRSISKVLGINQRKKKGGKK